MFKVMIKRTVPPGKEIELLELVVQLREAVLRQDGYVSGETLVNTKKTGEYLVISEWESETAWNKWAKKVDRKKLQAKIDVLLGKKSEYETYQYPLTTI